MPIKDDNFTCTMGFLGTGNLAMKKKKRGGGFRRNRHFSLDSVYKYQSKYHCLYLCVYVITFKMENGHFHTA